jgi:hypothetical protein
MVAQLLDPGLGRSRGEPVAQTHDVLLLGQRGPVGPFAAAAAADVSQSQRMPEFVQDRALHEQDIVYRAVDWGQPDLSLHREVAVVEQPHSTLRIGEGTEVRLARLDDEEPLMRLCGRVDQPERERPQVILAASGAPCSPRR